jgi:hypothetical protein
VEAQVFTIKKIKEKENDKVKGGPQQCRPEARRTPRETKLTLEGNMELGPPWTMVSSSPG